MDFSETNLVKITSFPPTTGLVDRTEAVDAICPNFGEVSDSVSPDSVIVRKGNID